MSFKTKKIKSELTLAEQLKALRLRENLSLANLSGDLAIQKKYLINLERGNYSYLPAPVYVKGALKRYANFFNVSFKDLCRLYDKERSILSRLDKNLALPMISPPRSLKPFLTPKVFVIGLVVLLFLGVGGYFIYQISFLIRPPVLNLSSLDHDLMTNERTLILNGQVSTNAQLTINGRLVPTTKDGFFDYTFALADGINTIRLVAQNPFGKKTEVIRRVVLK